MTYQLRDGRTFRTTVLPAGLTLCEVLRGDDVEVHVTIPHADALTLIEEMYGGCDE